jgi:hypothetical protein
MFSFGFQKAFQRGFEPDDEVFFTRVSILLGHTVSGEINANRRFQRAWKALRPSSRYSSILWFRRVTYVTRQTVCKPHATLFSFSTPHTYIGYFVFAAFASAFMLKVHDCPFYRRMEQASVLTSPFLQLLRPECSRFITPGLESEIYRVIERLINTFGSPQIAIDERHTPKLYSRFLASLLAKHKRDGAAHGRMPQQGPPTQQMPTNQGAPIYQQPLQQPQASRSVSSTRMTTGVSGANASDLAPSMTLNSAVAVSTEAMETKNSDSLGNYTFDSPPDFTFGATNQQGADLMDFTFDPITTPGNDDMLAAMQAIQSPNWLGNMLMPGSVDGPFHCRARAGQVYSYIITDSFGPRKRRCRIIAITIKTSKRSLRRYSSAERISRMPTNMVIFLHLHFVLFLTQSGGCVRFSRLVGHLDVILAKMTIHALRKVCSF